METPLSFAVKEVNGVQFRLDPLTQSECRINPARAKRVKQGETPNDRSLIDVIESSKTNCVFCPERILEKVPKFPAEIAPEGRIRQNQCLIFPNLNPFGVNHAVGVLSNSHYLSVDQLTAPILSDALSASLLFYTSVQRTQPSAVYPVFVMNYMPPSAGSIIHPHVQLLLEPSPMPELAALMQASTAFAQRHKQSYWELMLKQESQTASRLICVQGVVHVLATFSPRALYDIGFYLPGFASLFDLTPAAISDLSLALSKVLAGYKALGVGSFNLVSYSAQKGAKAADFCLHFRLIARPSPRALYTSDTGPCERMYGSWVVDSIPEDLCKAIREHVVKQH